MAIKIFGGFRSMISPPVFTINTPVTVEIIPATKMGWSEYKRWKR